MMIRTVILLATILTEVHVHGDTEHRCKPEKSLPHIIFIMADDAGWNDFSFHSSPQIPTPNIDALAFSGMALNHYYGSPLCTPTRGAVMTGKHPIHIRLQHFVITGSTPEGLPLEEKLLPQYLKEVGYSTYLVGKWHLGHSRRAYTPTYRGFDSHFGYWIGKQDYYDHFSQEGSNRGYDFRSNLSLNYDVMGHYDTDLFTNEAVRLINDQPKDKPMFLVINHIAPHSANGNRKAKTSSPSYRNPLQAPYETIEKFSHSIEDPRRRIYAAMVDKLDESVGLVVEALAKTKLLQNSIIVFASDNGGAPDGYDLNYGSNWPLRGAKNTLWEGGTRLAALLWSPFTQNRVSNDVFHATDWLPTIFEAIGCNPGHLDKLDGVSMWKTFTEGSPSPRTTLLYNIDDSYNNSAIRHNNWKLIQGNVSTFDLGGSKWDSWYGPSGRENSKMTKESLIPQISNSIAGKALAELGFAKSTSKLLQMQKESEVLCDTQTEGDQCDPYTAPCLFNLDVDPCEKNNLASMHPEILKELQDLLEKFNKTALPHISRKQDANANPMKWGSVWTTWLDNMESGTNPDFPEMLVCNARNGSNELFGARDLLITILIAQTMILLLGCRSWGNVRNQDNN